MPERRNHSLARKTCGNKPPVYQKAMCNFGCGCRCRYLDGIRRITDPISSGVVRV
jgi:hypothetical protein